MAYVLIRHYSGHHADSVHWDRKMGELSKGPVKRKEQHMVKQNRSDGLLLLLCFVDFCCINHGISVCMDGVGVRENNKNELLPCRLSGFQRFPFGRTMCRVSHKVPFFNLLEHDELP